MTRIDVHPTFAMMRGEYSKPRVVGRLRKGETQVQFLKRIIELYPACTVFFVRRNRQGDVVFEEVEKSNAN